MVESILICLPKTTVLWWGTQTVGEQQIVQYSTFVINERKVLAFCHLLYTCFVSIQALFLVALQLWVLWFLTTLSRNIFPDNGLQY